VAARGLLFANDALSELTYTPSRVSAGIKSV
jgi:hypothetical protein